MNEQSVLSPAIQAEIDRVAQSHGYDSAILSDLVAFAIAQTAPSKPAKSTKATKAKKPKGPSLAELKKLVFARFGVANTAALKKSPQFQQVSQGKKLDLARKPAWEFLKDCELLPSPPEPLSLKELKDEIYEKFSVKTTKALKASPAFQMAMDGMDTVNLAKRDGWEMLYRRFIGVLPEEENQTGPDCINGVNIFNYFRPWQVFGLDSKTAEDKDVKAAYYELSKIYHPDNAETGDSRIFQRLNQMYRSLVSEA
ncbi:MAG: DnaJ domain-containing protein [Cyanobacteria bacterium]|nr:DnaJ domain-containing protein [Cyanobacteriota bacterium]